MTSISVCHIKNHSSPRYPRSPSSTCRAQRSINAAVKGLICVVGFVRITGFVYYNVTENVPRNDSANVSENVLAVTIRSLERSSERFCKRVGERSCSRKSFFRTFHEMFLQTFWRTFLQSQFVLQNAIHILCRHASFLSHLAFHKKEPSLVPSTSTPSDLGEKLQRQRPFC